MAKEFIAAYAGSCGRGSTLEEALSDLNEQDSDAKYDRDDIDFYEGEKIEVEFKIIKRDVPTKVKVIK